MNPEILREANALTLMGHKDLADKMLKYEAFNDLADQLAIMGAHDLAEDAMHAADDRYSWTVDESGGFQ